jgi:hypothetical protein
LAGVIARVDQTSGSSIGFLNPALYALSGNANALDDITSPSSPTDIIRSDYINSVDSSDGILYSARTGDDQGSERYCTINAKGKEKCSLIPITLSTPAGDDNMTGLGTPGTGFVDALAFR